MASEASPPEPVLRDRRTPRAPLPNPPPLAGERRVGAAPGETGTRAAGVCGATTGSRLGFLLRVGGDLHLDDLVGVGDCTVAGGITLLDLVDVFHARGDLAPDRVFAVERRGRRKHYEELAVGAVRVGGARHRDDAPHMLLT